VPDKSPVVVIMAGGTGGHIFPALAVADELRRRGCCVHWLGSRYGMEKDLVPSEGYEVSFLPVRGLSGKGVKALLQAPFRLLASVVCALSILRRQRAMVVLGMGGYVSGPGSLAAWLLRKPLVLHEQNAVLGRANRLARPFAVRCLEAFPAAFPGRVGICTGTPLRWAMEPARAEKCPDADPDRPVRLLVLGGSLGAQPLNVCVPAALALMGEEAPEVWHQTGKSGCKTTQDLYKSLGVAGRVDPFITDMASAYSWADLVVCRSGGATVSELAVAGKASILVPYPWHKDQQQLHNARYLVDRKAAYLLEQSQMNDQSLARLLRQLVKDKNQLRAMSVAAREAACLDAAQLVSDHCMEVAGV